MHLAYSAEQLALRDELQTYFATLMTEDRVARLGKGEHAGGPTYREIVRQMTEGSQFSTPLMRLQDPEATKVILTTLADGTFAEWRAAHDAAGLTPGTPDYPSRDALAAIRLEERPPSIAVRRFTEAHADAASFLRALRAYAARERRFGS